MTHTQVSDSETAQALDKVAGYIVHRIEFPRLRTPPPEWKDSAKTIRGVFGPDGKIKRGRKAGVFAIEDKQRLGFRERKLSAGDFEEIRGACALVFSGAIPCDDWEDNVPTYRAGPVLWDKPGLDLEDWKNLFRASRAALRFDSKDGPGGKGRTVSSNELEDFRRNVDFHAGLCAGKSACDLDSEDYAGSASDYLARRASEVENRAEVKAKSRARFAGLAKDFRRALRFAFHASDKGRVQARKDWLSNLKTLRQATGAVAGSGHGQALRRKDGQGTRSLHARIGRFTEYMAAGFLAESNAEVAAEKRRALDGFIRVSLTACANC